MAIDSTVPRTRRAVLPGGVGGLAALAANSKQLAFQSARDGNFEIYTMNADGSGVTRLTTTPTDETGPSWR